MANTLAPAEVYFTSMRIKPTDSIPAKLRRLLKAAGFNDIELSGDYVAIKSHIGEMDNVFYLRPAYARVVAELLKDKGAKPFMADCASLYPGMRSNAIDFLACAEINGHTVQSCGCPTIVADGIRGIDDVIIPIENGELLQSAYIGRAFMDADFLLTISHAKGCKATGFSCSLKNVAMGCASRAGKMAMHSGTKPVVEQSICSGCQLCLRGCVHNAITFVDGKAFITEDCTGCARCLSFCKTHAIHPITSNSPIVIQKLIAEYAAAVLQKKPAFHIAVAIDITAGCDCFPDCDSPIVGDVGMFASFDPVALDRACADMINKQEPIVGTRLSDDLESRQEKDGFTTMYPETDWEIANIHAEKLGIGTREYRLIEVS